MPDAVTKILAVITGERGQREIVRPLAAVGQPCIVLDWEGLLRQPGQPHLRFIRELWSLLRQHPGAAVFTDMNSAFLAVILTGAALHGERVLMRLRGDPFAETHGQIIFHWTKREWGPLARVLVAWLLDRPLFTFVDRFVPVSHWIVRRLRIESRSEVVRIPVPVEQFPPRQHETRTPVRLLAVTNFNFPQKIAALGRFLDAHGEFLRTQGATITIAGTGIAWDSFKERHGAYAEFAGFVKDVAGLYATHDIFVHFSDLDAFPYVVLEAMAAGLPVMVNRDCGMLEQVVDGENGSIVDLTDPESVQAKLRTWIADTRLRAELGAAARQHVSEHYSLSRIGEGLQRALHP